MFERISRLAETMATNVSVSRRGFLGQLGHGATATAGAVAALLMARDEAQAAPKNDGWYCTYCGTTYFFCKSCPATFNGCKLTSKFKGCFQCC